MRTIKFILFINLFLITYIFAQNGAVNIKSYKESSPLFYKSTINQLNYSTLADSVIELKWDKSEPIGFLLGLSRNDTIAVTFDSVAGGKLDSVRIALADTGSAIGGVWETSTDTNSFSPLGKKLAVPITVTSKTRAVPPYPIPFKNWSKVDLRSFNISTSKPFTVAFAVGRDSVIPGFEVAKYPGKTSYHSFTYFTPKGGKPNWYFLTAGSDSIYIYLIRAYVTTQFATGVEANPKLTPLQYSLSQNYPNPFNPETVIKYTIAEESQVKIKIYNILGKTIAELVNSVQKAGEHSVSFNAAAGNLSSGVYFYSLEANSVTGAKTFSSVKKLIYMK